MRNIFPQEIINLSVEHHYFRFSKSSTQIYIFSLLFFIGIIISMFFIKIDVTIQSTGLIRSSSESIELTSPVISEVIISNIEENSLVFEGDTLLFLNKEIQTQRIENFEKLISQNDSYLKDLTLLIASKNPILKTELIQSFYARHIQKLTEYDLELTLLTKSFERAQKLFEKEVIPIAEKEDIEFQLEKVLESKRMYLASSLNEWQKMETEYILTNDKYKNEINELIKEIDHFYILSPTTGYITNYSGIQPGSYITTGQRIAVINPIDSLISEHLVSPKDIGYLRKEMPVVFQVSAYNYNQWGLATGEIINISNEIYIISNQPFFKVRCSLNEEYLMLKNGFKGKLKKGLTTTARFNLTKRSIAQLLFDKADDWLNPKIIE